MYEDGNTNQFGTLSQEGAYIHCTRTRSLLVFKAVPWTVIRRKNIV